MMTAGADVVHAVGADDPDGARRTLLDALADVRARMVEMAAVDAREWTGPASAVEVRQAAEVLADAECRTAAEDIARFGRKVGYRLVLHGSAEGAWTLVEFGGSARLRDYAASSPVVEYVAHPSWGQGRERVEF